MNLWMFEKNEDIFINLPLFYDFSTKKKAAKVDISRKSSSANLLFLFSGMKIF